MDVKSQIKQKQKCKFDGENPTGSGERAQKRLFIQFLRMVTVKTRSVSPKSCQLFILRQLYNTLKLEFIVHFKILYKSPTLVKS